MAYNPKIYLPSDWIPDDESDDINLRVHDFQTEIKNLLSNNKKLVNQTQVRYNLCGLQSRLLIFLKDHPDFIVCPSDKNLGICLIERHKYIKLALKNHLLDRTAYKQLSFADFNDKRIKLFSTITNFTIKIRHAVKENERVYLHRAYVADQRPKKRIAQFYIMPKIHKDNWKKSKPTRPVNSDSGSLTSYLSKWADVQLNKLTIMYILTFTRDSEDLRRSFQQQSPLQPG